MSTTTLSSINNQYVESVANKEPAWLAEMRRKAFSQFQSLPAEVSPLYSKYSDVNKIRPQNIRFADAQKQAAAATMSKELTDRLKELESETGILQVGQETSRV